MFTCNSANHLNPQAKKCLKFLTLQIHLTLNKYLKVDQKGLITFNLVLVSHKIQQIKVRFRVYLLFGDNDK